MKEEKDSYFFEKSRLSLPAIAEIKEVAYQKIDGFGATFNVADNPWYSNVRGYGRDD
jgi:hypothetical protein